MAATQEPPGGGEAKFHGLFMLFLRLTGKTLSDVTQPHSPPPCLYPEWYPTAFSLGARQTNSLGVKL